MSRSSKPAPEQEIVAPERDLVITRQVAAMAGFGVPAKPESALSRMRTFGQRRWIWPTMRATSSTAPALASMFDRRSLAASRCRPQKT